MAKFEIEIVDRTPQTASGVPAWAQAPGGQIPGQMPLPGVGIPGQPLTQPGQPLAQPGQPMSPEMAALVNRWMAAQQAGGALPLAQQAAQMGGSLPILAQQASPLAGLAGAAASNLLPPASTMPLQHGAGFDPARAAQLGQAGAQQSGAVPPGAGMSDTAALMYQMGLGRIGQMAAMQSQWQKAEAEGGSTLMPRLGYYQAVSGLVGDATGSMAGMMRGMGGLASSLVRGNESPLDTLNKVVDGVVDGLKKIPIVGEAVGGALSMLISPAKALSSIFGSMTERGKELGQYSGEIAGAQAMAEVRTLMADIKESQTMGGEYSRLITAESEMNIMWREAVMPIKVMMAEHMVEFVEWIKPWMENELPGWFQFFADMFKGMLGLLEMIHDGVLLIYDWTIGWVSAREQVPRVLDRIARNTAPRDDGSAMMENVYAILGGAANANVQAAHANGPMAAMMAMGAANMAPPIVERQP